MSAHARIGVVLLSLPLIACSAAYEDGMRQELDRRPSVQAADDEDMQELHGPPAKFSGHLDDYVHYALKHSPAVQASVEEWRAATYRISAPRRLPDPVISYGYFIQSVETRVGPQRHRFGIEQRIPWPGKLVADAEAASLAAKSAERRVEARGLAVTRRVATAYWQLWLVEQKRRVYRDQRELLKQMSVSARARLEVGKGAIADVGQIDLGVSRMSDMLSGLDETRHRASASLVAALGAPPDTKTPVADKPPALLEPVEKERALADSLPSHPDIESLELMARSRSEAADGEAADGYPSFMLGLQVIETGEAAMPNTPDSGKDPVILSVGMSLPLWRGAYDGKEDAARADSSALVAKRQSALDEARAELTTALSSLRDAKRRVRLYGRTLLPQASTVFESVLGQYQTGDQNVAASILAHKELLELQLGLFQAEADHAVAWARLEEVVGRALRAREVKP